MAARNASTDSLAAFEARAQVWLATPERFGLDAMTAAAFAAAAKSARAAAELADAAARAAAHAADARVQTLARVRDLAAEAIATIHAHALTQESPAAVCGQAMVPPIPTVSAKSAPLPARPDQVAVTQDAPGTVTLRWRCPNPVGTQGTVYHIARRVGDSGAFTHLGSIGIRVFVDTTAPHPSAMPSGGVQYVIQAQRGAQLGPVSEVAILEPPAIIVQIPTISKDDVDTAIEAVVARVEAQIITQAA